MTEWKKGDRVRVIEKVISEWVGRIVAIEPGHNGQRAFVWVERRLADGTVERDTYNLGDLRPATADASRDGLLDDVRAYLERVCAWYEGDELPGEIPAKRLIERIYDERRRSATPAPSAVESKGTK